RTGPPVRDVLEAVPDGDGGALVDEDQDAGAGFEDEVHVAVRLAELGLAGEDPAAGLEVGPDGVVAAEEPPAEEGGAADVGRRIRIEVDVGRLEDELEIALERPLPVLVGDQSPQPEEPLVAIDRLEVMIGGVVADREAKGASGLEGPRGQGPGPLGPGRPWLSEADGEHKQPSAPLHASLHRRILL